MKYFKPKHKVTRKPGGVYFQGIYYEDKWDLCKNHNPHHNKITDFYREHPLAKCICGCQSDNHKSKRYKRYIKQCNEKKYKLKPLVKYNKPKLVNHCCQSKNSECYFCGYWVIDEIDYCKGYYEPLMFGKVIYYPKENKRLCHDCSQQYIYDIVTLYQLRKNKFLPHDCWKIIKDFLVDNSDKNIIYKFNFFKFFTCGLCGNYIQGSKGCRIKCGTACEILRRTNQYISVPSGW